MARLGPLAPGLLLPSSDKMSPAAKMASDIQKKDPFT